MSWSASAWAVSSAIEQKSKSDGLGKIFFSCRNRSANQAKLYYKQSTEFANTIRQIKF
jgi:hypothetical protein